MTAASAASTVYVIGGYISRGGTLMAYHLAKILHLRFGLAVIIVTLNDETLDPEFSDYDPRFPAMSLDRFEQEVGPNDILICNPSFSDHHFGIRLDCLKIMYVQDFATYRFIDRFFDHYVAVSEFVHDFLRTTYGLTTSVIPPFISLPFDLAPAPWHERPATSLLINSKRIDLHRHLLPRLRRAVSNQAPDVEAAIDWEAEPVHLHGRIPHADFCRKLASPRYLLTLSATEGFGLVPLETMAMGTVVVGFDGFGGRQYLRHGENCLVRTFPDVEGVATDLIALIRDPLLGARLIEAGRETAAGYGYDRFRDAWERKFDEILGTSCVDRITSGIA
jgi:glycosyltransferase involved in cell wall biosynthesis